MSIIGYVFHPSYLLHDTGYGHPESAARLESVMDYLKSSGLLDRLVKVEAHRATGDEISLVHIPIYKEKINLICSSGGGSLDADTILSTESCNAAEYAAGGAVTAVEAVMGGNVGKCFGLVRPPGHHAFADRGSGFCIYNNIAIAARFARQKYGLTRIAILDFDVHHGNGTQSTFNNDPATMYVSVHQSPHYPGSGSIDDIGIGGASGTKVNIPLPAGSGNAEYTSIYNDIVMPAVRRFKPELILVSAGYDAHRDDPLAGMKLTESGYAAIASRICILADELCSGKAVFCLEGGYNLDALARSVAVTFRVLLGEPAELEMAMEPLEYNFGAPDISGIIAKLKRIHHIE
ncbi:histone deacetylase family protein [Dehalogenimonas etheniformans]|uniref:Histone deacetylase n=1 Tax=Dehalogenimonas etheniformans TaxID=1536648 RepID=A0A2P5P6R2_9CHLR|nr:histone deacetylase [Dehalogenimonas etheniformans]PPD57996.1 histone deacetylase [Dehalogenimonas etheniformans]QNT75345.1 histone deacetylase [Dehalogenimonas etheniformans]